MVARPIPLDEYPIHQAPLSMRHVVTSDRNAYDRSIFHVFDHTGAAILVTGLGVYPNVGVIDAYATVRRGDTTTAVRASDALGDDRMKQAVGPLRIEVVEPLRRLRLVCDGAADELSFEVTWDAAYPAMEEPHHVMRNGERVIVEGRRFVQGGTAHGVIRVGGEEIKVTPDAWTATRDRSWGVRPIRGEAPGRYEAEAGEPGFYWLWVPMCFPDHFVMVIVQEDARGERSMNEAVRVWPESAGRGDEKLGWPLADITYRSGTRMPVAATLHLVDPQRNPVTIEIEPLTNAPLSLGTGYQPDPAWSHGEWKGRGWVERQTYDLTDPAVVAHTPFGLFEHAARVRCGDAIGYALFEHGSIGRHDPSGFKDLASVAP